MKTSIYSLFTIAALTVLAACQKDDPFVFNAGEGVLNCEAVSVDYINSKTSRATGVNIADFDVSFVNVASGETVRTFKYHLMPELVALPKGDYRVEASYGDNPVAEWEAPYYLGNSTFTIEANKITDNVDPVECRLSNMRISVNLDDMGFGILGDDAKVIVKAGKEGSLTYDKTTTGKSGYFRYVEGSHTITATFSGSVNGNFIEAVSRTYDNANAGNYYNITFSVSTPDNVEPGDIEINGDLIRVDATITTVNQNETINPGEPDPTETDNMRPVDGGEEGPNEPTPDEPTPDEPGSGPAITPKEGTFTINQPYDINQEGAEVEFDVTTEDEGGFTQFDIVIDSTTLTPEELEGVGLGPNLDLINPGEFADGLTDCGFPINIGGQKSAHFNITGFLSLIKILGPGNHKFIMTISDANGTTKGTLWLVNN